MIILTDTFNKVVLSRQRTVSAAVRAKRKHDKMIKKNNGQSSYVPYKISHSEGWDISGDLYEAEIKF